MLIAPKEFSTKFINNLPLLEHIELADLQNSEIPLLSIFHTAPKLRSLHIKLYAIAANGIHSIRLPWNQLTSLNLWSIGVDDCFMMLQQMPGLVTLHVSLGHSNSISFPHIQLDYLAKLVVDYATASLPERFFESLTFPSLTRFECNGRLVEEIPAISSMLTRSSTLEHLKHLTLGIFRLAEPGALWQLSQVLEAAPHVISLTVVEHSDYFLIGREVFEPLTTFKDRYLLPNLQHIVYRVKQFPNIKTHGLGNGQTLVNMIEPRRRVDRNSGILQIRSVLIECPDDCKLYREEISDSVLTRLQELNKEKVFEIRLVDRGLIFGS